MDDCDIALVDKIIIKMNELGIKNNLSRSDLNLLLENTNVKSMLKFFEENFHSKEKLKLINDKIENYQRNKAVRDQVIKLKEKKENLMKIMENKKSQIKHLQENKQNVIQENIAIHENIRKTKHREENIIFKRKILINSDIRLEQIKKDFDAFDYVENIKYSDKSIIDDLESIEEIIPINKLLLQKELSKENYKKIPNVLLMSNYSI